MTGSPSEPQSLGDDAPAPADPTPVNPTSANPTSANPTSADPSLADPAPASSTGTRKRSSGRTVLRGGAWGASSQFASLVVNLALTPYVLHGLGVTRYGLFLFITTISTFLGSFDGGLLESAQRYFTIFAGRDDKHETTRLLVTLLILVTGLGLVFSLGLWFLAPPLAHLFRMNADLRPEAVFMLRTVGVLLGIALLRNIPVAVLQARQRFALTSMSSLASYAVYTVGIVLTVERHWGLRGVALTLAAQQALATAALIPQTLRYFTRSGMHVYRWSELRDFLSYASRMQVAGLASLFLAEIDILLVGSVLSIKSVALYGAGANFAYRLRNVPMNGLAPVLSVLGHAFGRGSYDELDVEFRRLQRLWTAAMAGWCTVGASAAYFGITAWLGSGFEVSGVVALICVAGNFFYLAPGVLTAALGVAGSPGPEARFSSILVVTNVVVTLALLVFGPVGVAAGTAISQFIAAAYLLRLIRSRKEAPNRSFLADVPVVRCIATATVVIALEFAIRPYVPRGPGGLLVAGIPAAIGLVGFGVATAGPDVSLRYAQRITRMIPGLRSR